MLHVRPVEGVSIDRLNVKVDSQVKSYAVSLLSHEELLMQKKDDSCNVGNKKERQRKNSASNTMKSPPAICAENNHNIEEGEVSQEDTEGSDMEDDGPIDPPIKEEPAHYFSNSDDDFDEESPFQSSSTGIGDTSVEKLHHQLKALQTVADSSAYADDDEVVYLGQNTRLIAGLQQSTNNTNGRAPTTAVEEDDKPDEMETSTPLIKQSLEADIEKIRQGWNSESKNASTVGELYLMVSTCYKFFI